MLLKLNTEKLKALMQDFYVLTQIRLAVIDDECHEILAYPNDGCSFCKLMRSCEEIRQKCRESDAYAFAQCRKTGSLLVYKCHAGLMEACAPIKDNGIIIGYIMFGQITDIEDKQQATAALLTACADYPQDKKRILETASELQYKSTPQIHSAAKILEACAYYALLHQLVGIQQEALIFKINKYIDSHLQESITAQTLCHQLQISRTRLYEVTKPYLGEGIGGYIRKKRIEKAKKLLEDTDYSVFNIADMTGFSDYTYFSRVFKKYCGLSPNIYRKSVRDTDEK